MNGGSGTIRFMSKDTDHAKLLTMSDVADLLGCSKGHVYRLIKEDAIKTIDISQPSSTRTKQRIRLSDLLEYIHSITKS